MARRLISPATACQGCGLVKAGFLGMVSPLHYQRLPPASSKRGSSGNNYSSFRTNLTKEGSHWTRTIPKPSLSLHSSNFLSKRTSCSVATEPPPAATEGPEMDLPKEIFLKDYKKPDYFFDTVDLEFQLGDEKTIVTSKIGVSPGNEVGTTSPLALHGRDLKLLSVKVNGTELKSDEYTVDPRHLTILTPPAGVFTLEIVTEIYPQLNTSLEGLYRSTGNFCTQCEAEGFRKITYFQDRPDVMAKYTCRIEGASSSHASARHRPPAASPPPPLTRCNLVRLRRLHIAGEIDLPGGIPWRHHHPRPRRGRQSEIWLSMPTWCLTKVQEDCLLIVPTGL